MALILVLDTAAFYDAPLRNALVEGSHRLHPDRLQTILPTIVLAERLRQLRSTQGARANWLRDIKAMSLQIEPFGEAEAHRLGERATDASWKAHARDYLIATHVHGDRIAVTADQGPAWRGVRAMRPSDAEHAIRTLLDDADPLR